MHSPLKLFVAVSLGLSLTQITHADLVQAPTSSDNNDVPSLAAKVLNRDNYNNQNLPSLESLSISQRSNDAVRRQTLNSKVEVPQDEPSVIDRLNSVASNTVRRFTQTGVASWYGRQFHGRKTASGDTFDMNALTAAHRSLPLNCYIRVTNKDNGKSVVVKVNDRGPFHGNRVLDLSYGAAKRLGITNSGTAKVSIERVESPNS
ncbi:septal ring lytic transglycosylase RlpA family protein [Acinetobacter rathckeae]|uniref:septal ring lytic transglycosylase RlpA family protein n=1 Tax=Acinetobacter rathckeae TaxID=2605272 RepID=UPI0018A32485|nr:septal ring lytic transglycosylase RlpA family protein [Acinetobacter rathckeae]MBF7687434.1 septal ring lytic transglycosylase RlpA family protein [Acinetobacter rathckeae]MBF7694835.1 septal ring lytic transglycosylase RlpA family protein [Acinetobacter rathckeae]